MSCTWDVGCKTCDVDSGVLDEHHGENALLGLIKERANIAPLAGLAERLGPAEGWRLDFTSSPTTLQRIAEFFAAHVGHDLAPRDEYGRWLDQCHDYFKCSGCAHSQQCALAKGHDGPHAPARAEVPRGR